MKENWHTEQITTVFIARPQDLPAAHRLFLERLAMIPPEHGEVLFVSTPETSFDEYHLWDLRAQAGFETYLGDPMEMEVYSICTLLRVNPEAEEVSEKLFFEDHDEPTAFPGYLARGGNMLPLPEALAEAPVEPGVPEEEESDPLAPEKIEPGQWLLTFYVLAEKEHREEATRLFRSGIEAMPGRALTSSEHLQEVEEETALRGSLVLRNIAGIMAGREGRYPLIKKLYRGRVVVEIAEAIPRPLY
ncbi:hypothetical protein [Corynebacterium lowii]|uniref:Uncharacterized protein n=1 Tax=Corynebacterium lowii TaxID=1544413 RepID=A0A0Q0UF36_9CORY|nr:hypothetical protein [Corynebacterium lowii]KQB86583.1 hypothetical protein Clow_00791 [Corynebacterium lowii]MDP9851267.1 hypothetical protein [Corynebacterium lowii]